MLTSLKPLNDKVVVERIEEEPQTASGIYLGHAVPEVSQWGIVKAVGQGRYTVNGHLIPLTVQVGDTVFMAKYAGTEGEDDLIVIKEDEILGYIREG